MAAEETVQTLAALTVIGSVVFVLLMWFNIASLMKYLRRDKTEEADEKKQHSGLFWAVDGILTFLFSLDFLTLFIILI
jgi:predicted RND superfamily exporter protein